MPSTDRGQHSAAPRTDERDERDYAEGRHPLPSYVGQINPAPEYVCNDCSCCSMSQCGWRKCAGGTCPCTED